MVFSDNNKRRALIQQKTSNISYPRQSIVQQTFQCNDIDTYRSCFSSCHKTWCKTKVLRLLKFQAVISSVLAIKITVFY